jgi:hypothetical protein
MKKLFSILALTLVYSTQAFAGECFTNECTYKCCCQTLDVIFNVDAGYRQDNLEWAYPGTTPGLSIHENWKDLNIGYVGANTRITKCDEYVLKLGFDYGWAGRQRNHHVELRDHNAKKNNRTYSNLSSTAHVYDIIAGLGYQCNVEYIEGLDLTFAPFVGWSYSHQEFKNDSFYDSHKFTSSYFWTSPWIGFESSFKICEPWTFYMAYSYHPGCFHSKINELIRSHKHHTRSYGNELELSTSYYTCEGYWMGLNFKYKNYWTKHHRSLYDSNDGSSHKHRATWNSYSIGFDVGYIY